MPVRSARGCTRMQGPLTAIVSVRLTIVSRGTESRGSQRRSGRKCRHGGTEAQRHFVSDTEVTLDWLVAANRLALIATQLSNVIHETNNILQIISGNAELIVLADPPPPVVRRARVIADQTQRASELLGQVLKFARDVSSTTERVDMNEIVNRAFALRRYSLAKARINVTVDASGEFPAAGNGQQLLQAVLIVLMNAEQALSGAPEGRITVQFAAGAEAITIRFTDTSSAQPAVIPDVSDVFATDAAWQPAWNPAVPLRLGIGLRVAKHLLESQGGTLAVTTAALQGTSVLLTLPKWREQNSS
jgi:signal transduction histidine kinase